MVDIWGKTGVEGPLRAKAQRRGRFGGFGDEEGIQGNWRRASKWGGIEIRSEKLGAGY